MISNKKEEFLIPFTFPIFKDLFVRNILLGDNFAIILAGFVFNIFMFDFFYLIIR